ncbi:hypothetical protein AKJ09_03042 [Labilithrix luteola]|uniref:Uncharacterized protein n=2 Tax=Labilithrix luteola TaxID=1391654 RepID=A0A0K1PS67_9BACT|nr:hypothetical protein AKJ09_03042 [Labilithrix luteola]
MRFGIALALQRAMSTHVESPSVRMPKRPTRKKHRAGFAFGSLVLGGRTYEHDVVVSAGRVRKRKKRPSKRYRDWFGHTPLSMDEDIPWDCERLIVGTGAYGALPVMVEVKREAHRRGVELVMMPTPRAIDELEKAGPSTNAILHVTC